MHGLKSERPPVPKPATLRSTASACTTKFTAAENRSCCLTAARSVSSCLARTWLRWPRIVRKLVVVSTPFKRDGWYPEVLVAMSQMAPSVGEMMKQSPLNQVYPNVNWAVLFTKLGALLKKEYDWSKEVAALKLQAMIVFADADAVRPAHIVEFYGLLGGGQQDAGLDGSRRPADQLAILPGLTHYNLSASPLLPTVVAPFLDAAIGGQGQVDPPRN
jgi:hypothetical protein